MNADALSEDELRRVCARLLTGGEDDADLLRSDEQVRLAVAARLAACGVRLLVDETTALCVVEDDEDLGELALACLALCAIALSGTQTRGRARVSVEQLWERVGKPRGYSQAYVRRAGLGPLEARGLLRVIKPEQRAAEAYVVAGPALRGVDTDTLRNRVKALRAA